jgi:hypothetical protein
VQELKKLTLQRVHNLLNKWAYELNGQFCKEGQMVNKCMKKRSTSLAKGNEIKTTLRFHLTPVVSDTNNNKCW